jgi:UDP-galactopyranose mutase
MTTFNMMQQKKQYDYLIVGSGLCGGTFACLAKRKGKKCLVVGKRTYLGSNQLLNLTVIPEKT